MNSAQLWPSFKKERNADLLVCYQARLQLVRLQEY
jgi:hypothetical protein